jgi:hypothetical protein
LRRIVRVDTDLVGYVGIQLWKRIGLYHVSQTCQTLLCRTIQHTAGSLWLALLVGLRISMSGGFSWSPWSESSPSSASASMSVTSVVLEPLDSTGDGSIVAGYGDGGGCSELSESVDALRPCQHRQAGRRLAEGTSPLHHSIEACHRVRSWRGGRVCVRGEGRLQIWTRHL